MTTTSRGRRWIWILALTNVITVAILVWILRKPNDTRHDTCPTCYSDDYCAQPFDRMPMSFAKALVANYRDNQWRAINRYSESLIANKREGDSRSAWFSLPALKRFIYEIETRTCQHCDNSKNLGIRIYYGAYGNTSPASMHIDPLYAGLHTLMMVPTFAAGEENIDFDPDLLDQDCAPKLLDSTVVVLIPEITSRNHGELIPPPYNCTDYKGAVFMRYADTADYGQECPPTGRQ